MDPDEAGWCYYSSMCFCVVVEGFWEGGGWGTSEVGGRGGTAGASYHVTTRTFIILAPLLHGDSVASPKFET